jgi:hypothetical protein
MNIKKSVFFFILTLSALTSFAQLKVNSFGRLQIGLACNSNESEPPTPMVSIGDDSTYIWSDFGYYNAGLVNCKTPSTVSESIGLYSEVFPKSNGSRTSPVSTGIWGLSYGSSTTNFGIVGGVNYGNGAGVYGTTGYGPCSLITGTYAGFFDGNTYVNGNLTTYGLYNLSDMRLKKNVTLLSETADTQGNALDHLQKMNVIEYNLVSAIKNENRYSHSKRYKDSEGFSDVELYRCHYGLSAQELQGIYPDLVLEGQDGYLAVNYIELVPILIRSIQELKQELDEVKGISKAMTRSVGDETADFNAAGRSNELNQNTPNPFKEQTVIRFSLADNAQNANICIYDMTGKQLQKLPISSGDSCVSINGWELGEGMFLYSLIVNGQEIDTKKMVITK